jgi:hypothetical protein
LSGQVNPRRLYVPWSGGFALDVHTLTSTFLGNDSAGRARFETIRSPLGELLYRLKYQRDQRTIGPIVESVVSFWQMWHPAIDANRAVDCESFE